MPVVERPGPEVRRSEIMAAGLKLARRDGLHRVTRESVAEVAKCSPRLMNYYFGSIVQLRRAVMRAAIEAEDLKIIAQGLALNDKTARKAPEELKQRAAAALV